MENRLTLIEIRLIHMQIFKQSAADIAVMLDKPVEIIQQQIFILTGGQQSPYELYIQKKEKAVRKKKEPKIISRQLRPNQSQKLISTKDKPFKTLATDHSKMKSVKIDSKTTILVPVDADETEVRFKYANRNPTFLQPENPNKVIKKFK